MPDVDAQCDVCGARLNRKFGTDLAGKFVCTFCNKYRHVVHALRYVEHMAAKECQELHDRNDVVWRPDEDPYGDNPRHWSLYCRLDCTCDTCSARKVIRFMRQWQATHGQRPVRR